MNGIEKFGENGLFVSLEENRSHYAYEMSGFGWDIDMQEKRDRFKFIDASPIRDLPSETHFGNLTLPKKDFSLITLLEVIKNQANARKVERIVVDPISHLIFQYSDVVQRRKALLDLVETLSKTGATCLLSSELKEVGGVSRRLQLEEYLAHGVILLTHYSSGAVCKHQKILRVEKMRGSEIDETPRPYSITNRGIVVHSNEKII